MGAYADGSNIYALIQFEFQNPAKSGLANAVEKHSPDSPAAIAAGKKHGGDSVYIDSSSAYLVTDRFGFIASISPSAQALFGYSSGSDGELLIGSSVRTLFPGLDGLQGFDLVENIGNLIALHNQGYLLAATARGESRYLDIKLFHSAKDQDQLIVLCTDCTEVSQQADELLNRGQLFDLTSQHIADGIALVDAEGFLLEINPIAEQLLGFTLDKSKPQQIHIAMPLANEETGVAVTPVHDALNKAMNIESDQSLLLKVRGATPLSVSVSAFPLRDAMGRINKCLVVFRPLSEARRVSSRLKWQAMHDTLTGLPNRASLSKRLQKAIEIARLEGAIHALLYIDL